MHREREIGGKLQSMEKLSKAMQGRMEVLVRKEKESGDTELRRP